MLAQIFFYDMTVFTADFGVWFLYEQLYNLEKMSGFLCKSIVFGH